MSSNLKPEKAEHYHFSHGEFGQCEQCGTRGKSERYTLQPINYWHIKSNSRRIPYYLYVCDDCFDSRESWCTHIYPDNCELCKQTIEDGEHYLEKELNEENQSISSYGLTPNEECMVICFDCHKSKVNN